MENTRWLWVRHFPVASQGMYVGQSDVSADIPALADVTCLNLPEAANAIWITSPLMRARQTMHWLRQSLNLPGNDHVTVPELMEQHFGVWEGQRYDAITEPQDWSRAETIRPPQGETFLDVMQRVHAWLAQAMETYAGRTVIAVCHAGPIRAALAHALTSPAAAALRFHLDYGSLTKTSYVRYENKWSGCVESVNRAMRRN